MRQLNCEFCDASCNRHFRKKTEEFESGSVDIGNTALDSLGGIVILGYVNSYIKSENIK